MKPTLPIDNKGKVFSSEMHGNHEQCRNKSDICKTLCEADRFEIAAVWLSKHRDECSNPIIPFVQERFFLTPLQAIEALKRGRALARGDRHE